MVSPRPLLLGSALALAACCGTPPPATSRVPAWVPLFDGATLEGWTPKIVGLPAGEDPRRVFVVRDGAIEVDYAGWERFDGAFGHLFHAMPTGDYRLRFECRFTGDQVPGAPGWAWRNSGVMIHAQDPGTMRVDQPFPVSVEVQLLGGDGTNDRPTANVCTPGTLVAIGGALDPRHCIDSDSETFAGDGWVRYEIEVRGDRLVRHLVNGTEVLAYGGLVLDAGDRDATAEIARRGGIELDSGWIALQAESHPCAFRCIEMLPLRHEE